MTTFTTQIKTLLTINDVAKRLGVGAPSVRSYRATAQKNRKNNIFDPKDMPEADLYLSRSPLWYTTTIDKWLEARPGRGRKSANAG